MTAEALRDLAIARGLDLELIPAHIAIIMDGNGRWANERGENRLVGHREGYATLRRVLLSANHLGVKFLTVYAFSAENWRRPREEVDALFALIEEAARAETPHLANDNVRVLISGRRWELPDSLQQALREMEEETANNTGITLVLAVNYGGRAEIVDACRALNLAGQEVDEESISNHLYCPHVPDPDLMIRTAGEMRWSNFLIWQAAYTELVVVGNAWPDFADEDLIFAIEQFQNRTRKFGGLASES